MKVAQPSPTVLDDSCIQITNGVLAAGFSRYGASLTELRLKGVPHSLVLGFPAASDYIGHGMYFGAVIGRYANRIANARFQLNGKTVRLDPNETPNHLHGGRNGLGIRQWDLIDIDSRSVCFATGSVDGDQGYPGNVSVQARYTIHDPGTLELEIMASCDAPTIVNFCHHPYFDLTGKGGTHSLEILAQDLLLSGPDLIPQANPTPLNNVPDLDFRSARDIPTGDALPRINNTYCLSQGVREGAKFAARLSEPGGVNMELWTNQPGLHLYTGYRINNAPPGHDGRKYGAGSGICLEAQNWPDAPNRSHFPNALLRPEEIYRHITEYRFSL